MRIEFRTPVRSLSNLLSPELSSCHEGPYSEVNHGLKRVEGVDTDVLIGKRLNDFSIRERIGRGGMASVYRAHQGSIDREVALKIIPLASVTGASDETFRRRFAREANLIASLEHIHILPVYDYGMVEDVAYLAMRLLRGGTLADRLCDGPLETADAVSLFCQFASGLHYAHRKGVIHRDLKPSNILLDDSGNALLSDFGLAKSMVETVDFTRTGAVVGTPFYMSPEQVLGRPVDQRSDIYSAGVVLYEMLVGRTPFGGSQAETVATLFQQIHAEPVPPSRINPSIPAAIEAVVLRSLSKEPEHRYPTIGAMVVDLERAAGLRSSSGSLLGGLSDSDSIGRGPRSQPGRRTGRWLFAAVGSAALVACLVLVVDQVRNERSQREAGSSATVRSGERGTASDAIPSDTEITRARERLGSTGFIAHVTCTQRTEYHGTQAREMNELARRHRLPYRVYDSDGDDYTQLTQIEKARVDGALGLILCPLNASLLKTPLDAVQSAGLPMVLMASDIPSYGGVIIAGDDYELGLAAGRFAGKIVAHEMNGRAEVVILGFPGLPSLVHRAEGLQHGLEEEAPMAVVVAHARGGTREFALESIGALIMRDQTFDVILSINDAGSFGAIAALERAGVPPHSVVISSVDAEALAQDYIRRGHFIRGSVATKREECSVTAIGAMVKLLAGSTVPEMFVIPPGPVVTQATLVGD